MESTEITTTNQTKSELPLNQWLDLEDETYHSLPYLSSHGVMDCLKSFDHYMAKKKSKEQTAAMRFGTIAHLMALEPLEFQKRIRISPEVDRRTSEGKKKYQEFMDSMTPDSLIVSPDEHRRLTGMRKKLDELMKSDLGWIFQRIEQIEKATIFEIMDHSELGKILGKAKMDIVGDDYILDYKTTQDAWIWNFGKTARWSYYDLQLFWYQKAEALISGKQKRLLILAQESEEPFEFMVYEIDQSFGSEAWNMIDIGFQKYLNGRLGIQPGYPRQIISLDCSRGH